MNVLLLLCDLIFVIVVCMLCVVYIVDYYYCCLLLVIMYACIYVIMYGCCYVTVSYLVSYHALYLLHRGASRLGSSAREDDFFASYLGCYYCKHLCQY